MSVITVATVLALAGRCQNVVAPETMTKIAVKESGLNPYALHDNATNQSFYPDRKSEAVRLAAKLIAAGRSIDVGLLQINRWNFPWLGLSLDTALDACSNIAAGAAVLTAYSRYNSGSPTIGLAYAEAVQAVRFAADAKARAPVDASTSTAPPDPFTKPAPTGRDVVYTVKRE